MRVAIIGGTGRLGSALVGRLAERGHHVLIGSRSPERAVNAAALAGALAQAGAPVEGARPADAVRHAELVVLTVPACGHRDALAEIAPTAAGRVVVDTCVCHHEREPGVWVRPAEGSSALRARRVLPASAAVAATLHAVSARMLRDPARFPPGHVPVAAENGEALAAASSLLDELGLSWLDAGGLEVAAALENLAALMAGLSERHGVHRPAPRFDGLPGSARGQANAARPTRGRPGPDAAAPVGRAGARSRP